MLELFKKTATVTTQDRDETLKIHEVYHKRHSYNGIFMGWNVYGKNRYRKHEVLLGTFDEDQDAACVVYEIDRCIRLGISYNVPQPCSSEDLLDMFKG